MSYRIHNTLDTKFEDKQLFLNEKHGIHADEWFSKLSFLLFSPGWSPEDELQVVTVLKKKNSVPQILIAYDMKRTFGKTYPDYFSPWKNFQHFPLFCSCLSYICF